jgi:circadian clock protein KaiC
MNNKRINEIVTTLWGGRCMSTPSTGRVSTGVAGLDEILRGGLIPHRSYLVRGGPGTGKTTLGLHYLAAGIQAGEKVVLITFGEGEAQIRDNASRVGIEMQDIQFLDLSPTSEFFARVESYDIFSAAEVEREPVSQDIVSMVQQVQPGRIFLDAMTQMRYLAADVFQFHKQTLSLLRLLTGGGATVLFTSEGSTEAPDTDLQFMSDGVVNLGYGGPGRTISISKFRGSDYAGGVHSLSISEKGIQVFPRLVPREYRREFVMEKIPSGIPELDELTGGGLERGTCTIITGPSGSGKTTLGMQFMKEAAGRGERSVVYLFEESPDTLVTRCESINIPVRAMMGKGTLSVAPIDPLQFSENELTAEVRREVEEKNTRIVMLDSLGGYKLNLKGGVLEEALTALVKYLKNMGVTVLIVNEVESITGSFKATEVGISYLADNLLFLLFLEISGELRKAIGVLKKRLSNFEKTLREFQITRYGLKVGEPLSRLRGLLTGIPQWEGGTAGEEGLGKDIP